MYVWSLAHIEPENLTHDEHVAFQPSEARCNEAAAAITIAEF